MTDLLSPETPADEDTAERPAIATDHDPAHPGWAAIPDEPEDSEVIVRRNGRVSVGSLLTIPSARGPVRSRQSSGKPTASTKGGKSRSQPSDLTASNRSGKAADSSSKALANAKKTSPKKSGNQIKVQQASAR